MKCSSIVLFLFMTVALCCRCTDRQDSANSSNKQIDSSTVKTKRIDQVTITADSLQKKYEEKIKVTAEFQQVAKKYANENHLSFDDVINSTDKAFSDIELRLAKNAIDLVSANDSVRKALRDARAFTYSDSNKTLANLAALYNNSKIDGFRIYVAKLGNDYTLIVVGTKDSAVAGTNPVRKITVDQIEKYQVRLADGTTKEISSLQDYSNPCRPCNVAQGSRF